MKDMINWEEIIEKLKELGVINVSLTGGEPLTHPQIREIIALIKAKDIELSLLTNGSLLTKEMVKFLSETLKFEGCNKDKYRWRREGI